MARKKLKRQAGFMVAQHDTGELVFNESNRKSPRFFAHHLNPVPGEHIKNSLRCKFYLPGRWGISNIHGRYMKQLTALLTIFAMISSQGLADNWIGGPYGNNTYDGFDSGIFQYTFRGNNVMGMARFSQNNSSAYNSEFGDSVTYYNGVTYYGESYGFVDFASGACDGIANGTAAGTDLNNPAAVLRSANGTSFGVFNGVRYGTGNPLFGPFTAGGPEATHMVANTSWGGSLTRKFPVPRFSGVGESTFFGEGESTDTSFDRTLVSTGDFIPPGPVGGPGNGTQRNFVTVPSDAFKNKVTVPITVFGGRISTAPFLGSNAFQAL